METSLAPFSDVFLGTPVWAGNTPPAINSCLARANLRGKRVWLFITQADVGAPSKAADSVLSRVGARCGRVMDLLRLKTWWDPKTNVPSTAEELRGPVAERVEKIAPRMKNGG